MATTSTVPTALDELLADLTAAMTGPNAGVNVWEAWPGPSATGEMVVLGEVTWDEYKIATIKAGRKYRDEEFAVAFQIAVFGAAGTTPANPKPERDRAFAILAACENVLANDPTLGAAGAFQWLEIRPSSGQPVIYEKSWAWRIAGTFTGRARIT